MLFKKEKNQKFKDKFEILNKPENDSMLVETIKKINTDADI